MFNCTTDRIPPIVVNLGNAPAIRLFVDPNLQFVAANFAQLLKWNVTLAQHRDCFVEVFRPGRDDDSRLRFVKEHCSGRRVACVQCNVCSEQPFGVETGFGERYGKSPFRAIVRTFDETSTDQIANSVLRLDLVCEIDVRWRTDF